MDALSLNKLRVHAIRTLSAQLKGEGVPGYSMMNEHAREISHHVASQLSDERLLELGRIHSFLTNRSKRANGAKETVIYNRLKQYLRMELKKFANDWLLGPTLVYINVGIKNINIDSLDKPQIQQTRSNLINSLDPPSQNQPYV